MTRKRSVAFALIALLLGIAMWQIASADVPLDNHPAQVQVRNIMPSLVDSEAKHASGAYIPGVGGVIIMDLLRGPNSIPDKSSYEGTRDWAIYLMQTFGSKLDAVPKDETISIFIDFFDYPNVTYRQLAITSIAGDVADPGKYRIWLDGKPYDEVVSQADAGTSVSAPTQPSVTAKGTPSREQTTPAKTVQAQTLASPAIAESTARPQRTQAPQISQPAMTPTALPANFTWDFADTQATQDNWIPAGGTWVTEESGYAQTALGKYDLISLLGQSTTGDFRLQVDTKYLEGDMGAGLVFNAPTASGKQGAQMVSYTGKGTYMQWGYYDDVGVFQYQGGTGVKNGADGKWHQLAVRVIGSKYNVSLDGTAIGRDITLKGQPGGYIGLLSSTSHVVFANLKLERSQP